MEKKMIGKTMMKRMDETKWKNIKTVPYKISYYLKYRFIGHLRSRTSPM